MLLIKRKHKILPNTESCSTPHSIGLHEDIILQAEFFGETCNNREVCLEVTNEQILKIVFIFYVIGNQNFTFFTYKNWFK